MEEPIILSGTIVHGKALGRTVGMPTANLCVEEGSIPKDGVYATRITINNETFVSVTNIGRRPSVDQESCVTVETFIVDFDKDVYGENAVLQVCKYLRPIKKFANLQEVQKQVQKDVKAAKIYFEEK